MSRPRSKRSRRSTVCPSISPICNSTVTARKESAAFPPPRPGSRKRSTPRGHVTVDVGQVMFGQTVTVSSDVLRQFAADEFRPSEEEHHHRRRFEWRRHRADRLSPIELHQRRAMGGGARAFPADRGSLARLLHDRPSERSTVHQLSRSFSLLLMDRDLRAAWVEALPRPALAHDDAALRSSASTRFPRSRR